MRSALNESTVELRHGRMMPAVDRRTGEIPRIEDLVSGLVHVDATKGGRSDGRLFRLIVPNDLMPLTPDDKKSHLSDQQRFTCVDGGWGIPMDGYQVRVWRT